MVKTSVLKTDWRLGARAAFDLVKVNGQTCVQKRYPQIVPNSRSSANKKMVAALKRERFARKLFAGCPWVSPLVSLGVSPHSLVIPFYKNRLGGIRDAKSGDMLPDADENTRRTMARQLLRAMYDIYAAGYAHCDLHPNNLYWADGQIIIADFESMQKYPADRPRPPFPESFDVSHNPDSRTMLGAKRRWRRRQVVGWGGHIFGVPTAELLAEMEDDTEASLERASRYWHTALKPAGRHLARRHGQPTVYTTIDLPHTKIVGARNSVERLGAFHATWARGDDLRGRSILDLGCNAGGMLFAAQRYGPGRCLGVEHDADKVGVANRIAMYNGLVNMRFTAGNLDVLDADGIGGGDRFDVVFAFAVEGHVKDTPGFFRLIGEKSKDMVYFETNAITPPGEAERLLREEGGFSYVGRLPDGPDNGKRVLFLARK